ncbi:Hermansky-Pudlak syndrome 3 protein homolog [Tribolium madens]|uniref:Hermansky-Pudlak syndrome 3 protein homolog n=1 Tax=Tribolium madens TaxID=41895 RepID=UPI001CF75B10|nr:Hermansky-Pudlak syndrome 3 protein homolog [Tribolium madens]XP_044260159.1 Hermansky-Pudlak syndrome 3 protein homolog [Tribolium madens]
MVRVISVHHFAGQNIQTVEQPTACTVAPPDKLLLALTSNCIEVRDLKNESEVLFSFPSVDEVIQIVHCRNGDFVTTLETKFNRQNKDTNFVRVYINWDSVAALQQSKMTSSGVSLGASECGMVQPMRARIAGRVTPTTNQSELGSLEMIEIPVKRNPNYIECCQVSGNLFILSKRIINVYKFQVKTHDISKMRFIDFEEVGFYLELTFFPQQMAVCENYIACMNSDNMYLFKLDDEGGEVGATGEQSFNFAYSNDDPIDFAKLIRDETFGSTKTKLTVHLPSIVRENSIIHKHSPFTFTDKEMTAKIHSNSSSDPKLPQIVNLIQLKLIPILVENAQRQITEEFKCMILKPLYIDENLNKIKDTKILTSDYRKCLNSVVCMVATQQEGYLHYFCENEVESDHCVAVYPFTAPVQRLVMEDYFLHALTETGLESYTLRFGHKLFRSFEIVDDVNVASPSINDAICLVGLRPFLGVEQILLSENNLVLLANSESSPTHSVSSNSSSNASYWTLYNLELPTPKTIFNDISILANAHRFTSSQTYCHLMSEAHVILRVGLVLKKWGVVEENVKLIIPVKNNIDDVIETYRTSCALLADHYIMCNEDFKLAIPYYKMARVLPSEVLRRVKKVQEQSNNYVTKGLMNYLKSVLLEVKYSWEADKFFTSGSKQNFAETILTLLENHNFEDLPNLILKSSILREYSTDKLIQILTQKLPSEGPKLTEKHLALAVLHTQKCNTSKSQESLSQIPENDLLTALQENWELLFDTTQSFQGKTKIVSTFSEFAVVLITSQSDILSQTLVYLIMEKKSINLNKLIKVFLEYLPSSIGSDSSTASLVLQKTLELYFQKYFEKFGDSDISKIIYERGANEAMKLLVRSYLSQLQIFQLKEDNQKDEMSSSFSKLEREILGENEEKSKYYFDDKFDKNPENYLFSQFRYNYLDKMPPFQVEITSKLFEACLENYTPKGNYRPNDEADLVLKKLQAILSSQIVSKQVLGEVNAFLGLNENLRGSLSLQSIILSTNDAIQLLIEACPQCLLQFGKDRFSRTDEWKFLIASIQRRILRLSQNDVFKRVCFFHKKLLKDILTHVATSMTLDQLVQVFPQRISTSDSDNRNSELGYDLGYLENELDVLNEIQNYEPFVIICKETMHANQINKLITTTGQQLLCTLNL